MKKKVTRSSVAMVIQNFVCILYGLTMLISGLLHIFKVEDFFLMLFYLCITPLVLLFAGKAGVFKKVNFNYFFTAECNRAMTEFVYLTCIFLLPVFMMLIGLVPAVILAACLVINLVLSRIKKYNGLENDYLNLTQGFSLLSLVGAGVAALPLILHSFLDTLLEVLFGESLSWEIVGNGSAFLALGLLILAVFYLPHVLTRVMGISYGAGHHLPLVSTIFGLTVVGCVLLLIADIAQVSAMSLWLIMGGVAIAFASELVTVLLTRKLCKELPEEKRAEIRGGKSYADIDVDWDKWSIKKWNAWKIALIFVLLCAFRVVVNLFKTIGLNYMFTTEMIKKPLLSSILLILVELVCFGMIAGFVALCIGLNGKYHTEGRELLPDNVSVGIRLGVWIPYVLLTAVMYLVSFFFIFFNQTLYVEFAMVITLATDVVAYYFLGSFLLTKVNANKYLKIWLPTAIFVVGQTVVSLANGLIQSALPEKTEGLISLMHLDLFTWQKVIMAEMPDMFLMNLVMVISVVVSGVLYQWTKKIFTSVAHAGLCVTFYLFASSGVIQSVDAFAIIMLVISVALGAYALVRLHMEKPVVEAE